MRKQRQFGSTSAISFSSSNIKDSNNARNNCNDNSDNDNDKSKINYNDW